MVRIGGADKTLYVVAESLRMQFPVRVLLVDDVAAFRSVARAYLLEISEVELIGEASGGDEALEQMVRLQPDLILMDIHMARGNGLATTRQIRALEDAPRVVLFSLQSDDAMRRAAFAAGADDFSPRATSCRASPPRSAGWLADMMGS
jgi:DNA-binding NarL/FixJ family response regulator